MAKTSRKSSTRQMADSGQAKIGFIGAGKMAQAIIQGLVKYGRVDAQRIHVAAPSNTNVEHLKEEYKGIKTSKRNIDIFGRFDCDIIFICVNPHVIRNLYRIGGSQPAALTTNYIPNMRHPAYVLSLVFGFTTEQIKQCLLNPEDPLKYSVKFHRCVISPSVAYGVGNCYLDVEPDSTNLAEPVRDILSRVCKLEQLTADMMDICCIIAGAGMAFSLEFLKAMSDGGVKLGMARNNATKLTAKMISSVAQTLISSGKNSDFLKDEACSPSGGAVYGLMQLEKSKVHSSICGAVDAAFQRANHMATSGNTD
ncbi:pyrroline-5-carboxylate reductase 3-like [Dermatophagoides pteronyssinus]|uniref:Pyrroline-5-carboxylate reductase 3 n=1 Tax=Dermatophagoides pteronyssinus TaxID=6956 RepID=A0A6P6YI17_DERPT|nr:pyrroline-5-carboxylate reductase 3-like [Dermatophagoides pteronyssinus]